MAKIGSRSALRDRRRSSLKSAKLKLRLGNLFIGILCVVALAFLYIQPFYSVQFSYAVSAEQLQQILSEQMGAESVSEEDLSGVELNLGVTLTMEGKGLSGLLVDELDALLRLGNAGAEENGSGDPSSGSSETAALSARTGAENDDTGNDGTGDDQSGTSAEDSSGSSSSGGDAEVADAAALLRAGDAVVERLPLVGNHLLAHKVGISGKEAVRDLDVAQGDRLDFVFCHGNNRSPSSFPSSGRILLQNSVA